jgi:thioredoxin 1
MRLEEVLASNKYVVIDFYSSTCPPCKLVEEELFKIKEELGEKISLFQADQKKHSAIFKAFDVKQLPHVKLFRSGKPIWSYSGLFSKEELISEIEKK